MSTCIGERFEGQLSHADLAFKHLFYQTNRPFAISPGRGTIEVTCLPAIQNTSIRSEDSRPPYSTRCCVGCSLPPGVLLRPQRLGQPAIQLLATPARVGLLIPRRIRFTRRASSCTSTKPLLPTKMPSKYWIMQSTVRKAGNHLPTGRESIEFVHGQQRIAVLAK